MTSVPFAMWAFTTSSSVGFGATAMFPRSPSNRARRSGTRAHHGDYISADTLLLNLVFWDAAGQGDVLDEDHPCRRGDARRLAPRDPLRAWRASVPPCADAFFLGESIASAFDIYLVGRLLGHAPDSEFLEGVVPAMAEVAEDAGMGDAAFDALLQSVADDPDRAFADLRDLLFDTTTALVQCDDIAGAAAVLAKSAGRRFGPLLHYFEVANWTLFARARGNSPPTRRYAPSTRRSEPTPCPSNGSSRRGSLVAPVVNPAAEERSETRRLICRVWLLRGLPLRVKILSVHETRVPCVPRIV